MSSDTYVWIGGPQGQIATASNWYDETTKSVATVAPSSTTTLVFRPGTYSVTSDTAGMLGFGGGNLILLGGAHLTLISAHGATFGFDNVTEMADASLTLAGSSLWDDSTTLRAGATLDASHAEIIAHALGIFPLELGAVTSTGGTELFETAGLGNVPQPGFNSGHPGPGFVQTGGFTATETVTPGASTLRINLGTFARGSAPTPVGLGADNPNGAAGYAGLIVAESGSGFAADLFPSIAAAEAALGGTPAVNGYVPLGTLSVDTSTLGTHSEMVSLKSGGVTTETLIITDRIV